MRRALRFGPTRARKRFALAVVIALGTALAAPGPSAYAGSKVSEKILYKNPPLAFSPNLVYGPDGSPIDHTTNNFDRDPACPHAPGVLRHGKVYVDTYLAPLHSQVRFGLWTTYVGAVAETKVAIEQLQQREPSCTELYAYEPTQDAQGNLHFTGQLKALASVACQPGVAHRPNRWCQMQAYNATTSGVSGYFVYADPAVNMNLDTKCAAPRFNGGKQRWPTTYTEIHNAGIPFANTDVFQGTLLGKLGFSWNDPITIDDIQIAGGVANWDPNKDQPMNGGTAFVGYGKVQTASWSEQNEAWFDSVALKAAASSPSLQQLIALESGSDPNLANYATALAHTMVQNDIVNNTTVAGVGKVGDAYRTFVQAACDASPWISDTLDANNGMASLNANGMSLVNWVDAIVQGSVPDYQTHDFVCYQLQHSKNPVFKQNAAFGCQVWTFPYVLDYLWAHRPGNPVGLPTCLNPTTDAVAKLLSINFGCTNVSHFKTIFTLFRKELGG